MTKNIKIHHPNKGEDYFFTRKKNVCAYARVSNDLRYTSFNNQVQEYTFQIMDNPNWNFKGVFTDNGVSGFSVKTRVGFLNMIRTCKTQNIDLIITKSISRFARNTLDTLKYIQELKTLGTEVYFEKENIYTFDSSSELLLSLMSSVAEEEVKQVSKNVKWRIEKNLHNGTPALGKVYGYDVRNVYEYIINENESKYVKLIYQWFIETKSYTKVKQLLEKEKATTPTGKCIWSFHTIKTILQNPVYIGDLHRRKQVNIDGKKVQNTEQQQFYIKNHHSPILSDDTFNKVIQIINEINIANKKLKRKKATYPLTGVLYCGHCGSSHRRKVAYYKKKISGVNYSCSTALKNSTNIRKCTLNNIYEPLILESIRDFYHTLINSTKLRMRLIDSIENLLEKDLNNITLQKNQKQVLELEEKLIKIRTLNNNTIINVKTKQKELKLRELRAENFRLKKHCEEHYSIDYFKYLLDEHSNNKNMYILDNSIIKSLIHKVIVENQESIYIVLSSDSYRGIKKSPEIESIRDSDVLTSKTIYKHRKGKRLSLKYKVVFYDYL